MYVGPSRLLRKRSVHVWGTTVLPLVAVIAMEHVISSALPV